MQRGEITRLLTDAANGECHSPKGPLIAKDYRYLGADRNEAACDENRTEVNVI